MNSVLDEIMKATNADSEGSDAVSTNQTPKPGVDVAIGRRLIYVENISITTGLVSANTTSMLLNPLQSGKMKPNQLITHRLQLSQIERAYDIVGNASKEHAINMYIETDNL
ncbi:hypothetical protein V1505DRAFT_364972 [Lipomyces doorenjongii]